MSPFVLIAGLPGSGKTTLVERIRAWFPSRRIDGFTTREVRDERGQRLGFDLVDWATGEAFSLARKAWTDAPFRVGRYGVRPDVLDEWVERRRRSDPSSRPDLWVLDELGKMESLSRPFLAWLDTLDLTKGRLVATGPVHPIPAYLKFLHRWRPEIWEINVQNREDVARRLHSWLQTLLGKGTGQ